ncbi:hypothetical protein JCM5353_005947 [Sporobolomyces roseus]
MTIPALPTELLIKIFSAVSSPSDLYHILQASKRFASISRPFFYHHITIETQQQRERLKDIRDEDKKLVKKVTIKGVGPITIEDMDERSQSHRVIESLHVADVHFHLRETCDSDTYLRAEKLVELSISQQHGGGSFWVKLLACPVLLPSIQTLVVFRLTCYAYYDQQRLLAPFHAKVNSSDVSELLEIGLPVQIGSWYQQLHIFVSGEAQLILSTELTERIRHLLLLSLGSSSYHINRLVKRSSHIRFLPASTPSTIDQSSLAQLLVQPRDNALVFLSFPFPRSTLSPELDLALTTLDKNVTEVHFDEEEDLDSTSLIPRHFVDYVARMKRLKMEEEEKV